MTSQESQTKPGGNTKTPGHQHQLYRWILTIPYEDYTASQLSQDLRVIECKEFYFQAEIGETTGYKHWQVALSLKKKEYFSTMKNLFTSGTHLEPVKDWPKAKNYCKKAETRFEGPYNHESTFIKIIEKLRPWQTELEAELIEECVDDRGLIWYADPIGGKGKTQFCKYMAIKHKATVLNNASTKDIAYAMGNNPKIVLFNITRTVEDRLNYGAIEAIKDGMIFSGKYESNMKFFNAPHVVVFSNKFPDKGKVSEDRWDIRTFEKNDGANREVVCRGTQSPLELEDEDHNLF